MKLEQSRSQLFELAPKDAPIILRTFMESNSAGTSAIAVGFPSQYHFGFDAQSMRLAEIWKGNSSTRKGLGLTALHHQPFPSVPTVFVSQPPATIRAQQTMALPSSTNLA